MPVTKEQAEKFKYPMTALGNVSVGNRQYTHGEPFDAESMDTLNYLKVNKKASVGIDEATFDVVADVAKADKADAVPAPENTVVPSTDAPADAGDEGTQDESAADIETRSGRTSSVVKRR